MKHLLCLAICSFLLAGCTPGPKTEVAEQQPDFLVDAVPEQLTSIAYATQAVAEENEQAVSLVGRIYGGDLDAFDENQASFSIVDLPGEGHSHDDPGDCPFCKRKLDAAAMAIIQLKDEDGNIIAKPADQLLGLVKNQDVVVTGTAQLLDSTLIVTANSIHVPENAYELAITDIIVVEPESTDAISTGPADTAPPEGTAGSELPTAPLEVPEVIEAGEE